MMPELGFGPEDNDRLVASYSGGWQMRMCLGKILLQDPDLLLLDEPTNHLDLDAIEWLEGTTPPSPKKKDNTDQVSYSACQMRSYWSLYDIPNIQCWECDTSLAALGGDLRPQSVCLSTCQGT
jgi:ABC-type Na+ transport system ATPase subunit NatA